MSKYKQLASRMAVMLVAAAVAGSSAFAESRHSEGTRSSGSARERVRGGSVSARGEVGRGNDSRNGGARRSESSGREGRSFERRGSERRSEGTVERRSERRSADRGAVTGAYERRVEGRNQGTFDRRPNPSNDTRARNNARRSEQRGRGGNYGNDGNRGGTDGNRNRGGSWDNNRGGNRGGSWDNNRGNNRGGNHGGNHGGSWGNNRGANHGGSWGNNRGNNHGGYYHHGRISNCQRYGSGYRVWIAGAPYPFYVPLAYWSADRFRIGLSIGLGGYYNNGGYYDYYDGYRDGGYNTRYSEADFEGVVESVDWRRDSFVVRNEETGNFITVVLRDRDEDPVRPGDYVSVRGDWTTRGYFRAYDVDVLD